MEGVKNAKSNSDRQFCFFFFNDIIIGQPSLLMKIALFDYVDQIMSDIINKYWYCDHNNHNNKLNEVTKQIIFLLILFIHFHIAQCITTITKDTDVLYQEQKYNDINMENTYSGPIND